VGKIRRSNVISITVAVVKRKVSFKMGPRHWVRLGWTLIEIDDYDVSQSLAKRFNFMNNWCYDHLAIGDWKSSITTFRQGRIKISMRFVFKNESDAVLFKLKWFNGS
jgi:hypothetical protein